MFLYFIIFFHVSSSFAFLNFKFTDSPTFTDDHYIQNIIAILNSEYKFSHVTIICENETNFCTQICNQVRGVSLPVSIFKLKNSSVTLLGELNIFYFNSRHILLHFIRKNYQLFNAKSYFILFLKNYDVTEILHTLWIRFKIRRIILFDGIAPYDGSVYDIFSNSSKKITINNFVAKNLFKLNNFQNTTLRITLFERVPEVMQIDGKVYGANYRLLHTLSKKLNFTPIVQRSSDRRKFGSYSKGKYTGGLGDIVYGRSDIACNGYFIQKTHTDEYQYLVPMNMDYVCLLVPKSGKIPKYMAPFKCFPEEVWLAMMLAFVSVGLVRYFIRYIHQNHLKWKENSNILLNIFSVAINMPVSFLQYKYLSSRIILIIFLTQMYVIVTSFQGSLVMLLSVPQYYKDIDTLVELNRSGMEIKLGSSGLVHVFEQDSTLRTIAKKVVKVTDDDFLNFNFTFLARFIHHKQKLFRNFSIKKQNRSVIVHKITECPLMYYTTFIVAKNFPFVEEFNSVIASMIESGIIMKWDGEVMVKILKEFKPEANLKHGDEQMENKIFTLNDLEVAFMILIIGYCCSICIFIREIIKSKSN
ncbi:ionotropic receptor 21a-like [Planococcus citri]|uniref:ionotropic receptor 21a-like n=1 Tax=Planococcus citri TaxID=170843 RepID=UPI0031F8371E